VSGRRPDFSRSIGSEPASAVFDSFVQKVRSAYPDEKIKTGEFGACMMVGVVNDSPTTFVFDLFSKKA
jgi:D-Tyr-tRNAtyr deacylase